MTEPADLAVYVHWPYCARICPYCDFNVVRDRGRSDEKAALAAAIVADLETQAVRIGPRRLVSIFFGGGTPSLMDPDALGRVVETAKRLFPSAGEVEVTLEANPTDAEAARGRQAHHGRLVEAEVTRRHAADRAPQAEQEERPISHAAGLRAGHRRVSRADNRGALVSRSQRALAAPIAGINEGTSAG